MATIYDVAKKAGVSPKTVSRVLNGDAPVSEKTRKQVSRAMEVLGYVPSHAARMMRSNRSGIVGLITGAISAKAYEPNEPTGLPDLYILQAIQKTLSESGKTLMIGDTGDSFDKAPELARTFARYRVEGLIYVAGHHSEVELDLAGLDCPVVLANCFDGKSTPAVLPEDRKSQAALVERLIQSGHTRIGYLTLDPSMPASRLRAQGHRDALRAAGIADDPDLVVAGHERGKGMAGEMLTRALEALMSSADPPTVICCGNDAMAMRVYGILRARGLRVPDDISVAGFDDHRAISEMLFPPLTTVMLPYQEIGQLAADTLLQIIGGTGQAPTEPILVPGPVVWRSSVATRNSVQQMSQGRITK